MNTLDKMKMMCGDRGTTRTTEVEKRRHHFCASYSMVPVQMLFVSMYVEVHASLASHFIHSISKMMFVDSSSKYVVD